MESKLLRYFCAVVSHGSFTAAAAALGIAQPAMSMAIKRLEASLGLHLFHRIDRQISLTDEGQQLYRYAKDIVWQLDSAERAMKELCGLDTGLVRVGIPGMLGSYYFPPLLMLFRHHYPGVRLSIVDGGADQLQHMLAEGDIDLAFIVAEDVPPGLSATAILRMQMVAALPLDHPWSGYESIDIKEFLLEELVMFKPGYFHRRIIDEMALAVDCLPNISMETNLIHLMKSFVRRGFGITAFLDIVLEDEVDLVGVPFLQPFWLNIHLACRQEGYLSVANRTFKEFIIKHTIP